MTPKIVFWFLLSLLILVSPSWGMAKEAWQGPFEVKPQFPLTLPLLSIGPEKAAVLEQGKVESGWSLSYSNILMILASPGWDVGMDMELSQFSYSYKRGIGQNLELGAEAPLLSFGNGFMDQAITGFHQVIGVPDYRYQRPQNSFLYYIRRNGRDIIAPAEGKIGLGDISLYGKFLLRKDDPHISLKIAVQAPTGDPRLGFGNGSWDYAAALMMDHPFSESLNVYGNIGYSSLGDWTGVESISFVNYVYGFIGVEQSFGRWSLAGQVQMANSPFPYMGIYQVDNTVISGTAGLKYRMTGTQTLLFSVSEDINFSGAPDVSFNLSYGNSFR